MDNCDSSSNTNTRKEKIGPNNNDSSTAGANTTEMLGLSLQNGSSSIPVSGTSQSPQTGSMKNPLSLKRNLASTSGISIKKRRKANVTAKTNSSSINHIPTNSQYQSCPHELRELQKIIKEFQEIIDETSNSTSNQTAVEGFKAQTDVQANTPNGSCQGLRNLSAQPRQVLGQEMSVDGRNSQHAAQNLASMQQCHDSTEISTSEQRNNPSNLLSTIHQQLQTQLGVQTSINSTENPISGQCNQSTASRQNLPLAVRQSLSTSIAAQNLAPDDQQRQNSEEKPTSRKINQRKKPNNKENSVRKPLQQQLSNLNQPINIKNSTNIIGQREQTEIDVQRSINSLESPASRQSDQSNNIEHILFNFCQSQKPQFVVHGSPPNAVQNSAYVQQSLNSEERPKTGQCNPSNKKIILTSSGLKITEKLSPERSTANCVQKSPSNYLQYQNGTKYTDTQTKKIQSNTQSLVNECIPNTTIKRNYQIPSSTQTSASMSHNCQHPNNQQIKASTGTLVVNPISKTFNQLLNGEHPFSVQSSNPKGSNEKKLNSHAQFSISTLNKNSVYCNKNDQISKVLNGPMQEINSGNSTCWCRELLQGNINVINDVAALTRIINLLKKLRNKAKKMR